MIALVALAAIGIFALRASFLVTAGRFELPASWSAALSHARPAVLGSLLASIVAGGGLTSSPDVTALVVVCVAALASTRLDMSGTVGVGLVAIAFAGWLVG
jgi:branched-subunit amino acid transport protein